MGRDKFLLDLAWLIVVVALLVFGDYRRRDQQNELSNSYEMVRTLAGERNGTPEASLRLPLAAIGRHTF